MKIYVNLSHLAQFFTEREMFQTKVVQKIKPRIMHPVTFFSSEIAPFMQQRGEIL